MSDQLNTAILIDVCKLVQQACHWFQSASFAGWDPCQWEFNAPLIVDEGFVLLKRNKQSIETIISEGVQVRLHTIPFCSIYSCLMLILALSGKKLQPFIVCYFKDLPNFWNTKAVSWCVFANVKLSHGHWEKSVSSWIYWGETIILTTLQRKTFVYFIITLSYTITVLLKCWYFYMLPFVKNSLLIMHLISLLFCHNTNLWIKHAAIF